MSTMKTAIYIAITLHFSRKLLGKLRGDPTVRYMETMRRLRELPPDERVIVYENGISKTFTARGAANYIYAKMTRQPIFMTDLRTGQKNILTN